VKDTTDLPFRCRRSIHDVVLPHSDSRGALLPDADVREAREGRRHRVL